MDFDNKKMSKSRIILITVIVMSLIVIVLAVTYAYFAPKIIGEGKDMNVTTGNVNLSISESKINATNVLPILDSTKDTKAQKNSFTISRTEDSSLGACYSLYLVVDSIGNALKNEDFKYELSYGENIVSGDFSNLIPDEDGVIKIGLLTNQSLTEEITSHNYTLRLWLSYRTDKDQTNILTGDGASRTFEAHILASGSSKACKVTE